MEEKILKNNRAWEYDSLIRREILEISPYVPGKPVDEVRRELGITDVIKLASNENPLGPSPKGRTAVSEVLSELHIYPDGNSFYLKQALAAKLGVKVEELIIGNGSDEIIKLLAEAFFRPGDEVVISEHTFGEYAYAAHLMGAKIRRAPAGQDFGHDLEQMAAAVTERTKAVFICNPNNPTGTMITKDELEKFISSVPSQVLIVLDQAYFEYVEDPAYPDGIDYIGDGRVLVLRTFSKIYGLAGLRVGYGIGAAGLISYLNRVKEPFNVNIPAQAAARAALEDTEFLAKSKKLNQDGIAFLTAGFTELGLDYVPTQANFILFATPYHSKDVFQRMLEKGVIVRTGDIFGLPKYIRVTVGTEEQNERFLKALKEVLSELGK
ncbi:MAG TPA: histidinol-phosphate transaminase [Firmicutes bacterium]|jgi:histidinol-phosphate aminotransferase|nr:histidinol-phosphate transaminase [Bacillota bacterium]